jgi:hypothetical protein
MHIYAIPACVGKKDDDEQEMIKTMKITAFHNTSVLKYQKSNVVTVVFINFAQNSSSE